MKKNVFIFVCFFIIFTNCKLFVCAQPALEGVTEEVFDGWTDVEIANWFDVNFERHVWASNGFINAPSASDGLLAKFKLQVDIKKAGTETYEEWISRNCDVVDDEKGEPQVLISDDLSDAMYLACMKYIEEETGWYNFRTTDYRSFPSADFPSQGLYNAFISYCTQKIKSTDDFIVVNNYFGTIDFEKYLPVSHPLSDLEFYVDTYTGTECTARMTQNWESISCILYRLYDSGITESVYTGLSSVYFGTNISARTIVLTDGARSVRVYKSLEDLKSYSVGQRSYYTTSKFQDYDVNGDNSCVISESDLNNSSVWGDVYNIIINYPDGDGLTEDELRDILDDYFDDLKDDDGSGSGGSGGGSGLDDFIDGLGSIGDALLSIMGKLLEYIGKAIDLLSGTVMKVIDLIPSNITALIGGIFPFLPQEWLVAIELSLVLAVIVGIVGIFKK